MTTTIRAVALIVGVAQLSTAQGPRLAPPMFSGLTAKGR